MLVLGSKVFNLFSRRFALLCLLAGMLTCVQSGYADTEAPGSTYLDIGFRQMYNLDFDGAHSTFQTWEGQHPEDPMGAAANAAVYLFSEFERLHILNINLFTDDEKLEKAGRLAPDPAVKTAFQCELDKADDIAKRILSHSSEDRNALFARMLSDGLRGDYAALIERQKRDGLNFLKSSRSIAEKLIEIDPNFSDAYLALGIENYVLGLRGAATRWMLRLSGAQTNKDKGIADLKTAAEKGRYLAPYARLLLAIAALRDEDRNTAKQLLTDLAHDFPQNPLFQVELARLQPLSRNN
jgi:hypothetical protein